MRENKTRTVPFFRACIIWGENSSYRWFASYFCPWLVFMWILLVSTAIQHGARFKVTASCCDLPQRQYFEDLLNENGGVFSYDKNSYLPQNYKKQCSLGNVLKESEKKGRRRSTEWFERHFKDMLKGQAKIFPPKTNACVLCIRREGHLYEVFFSS